MKTIGIFEVKARISNICETVKESQEPVLITKRGVPLVKIIPLPDIEEKLDIWSNREKFICVNGQITDELPSIPRKIDSVKNLLDS